MARKSVPNSQPVASKTAKKATKTAAKVAKPAVKAAKPARPLAVEQKPEELGEKLVSISAISRLTSLDRATVKQRLNDAEIQPVSEASKETIYKLGEVLPALFKGGKPHEDAKTRKLVAEARRAEFRAGQEERELVSVGDIKSTLIELFRALDSRLVGAYPTRATPRIRAAKNARQVTEILRHDMGAVLSEVRNDFPNFLRRYTGSDSGA